MRFRLAKETKKSAFATRVAAAELRTRLTQDLASLPVGETFEIDLDGVEAMTISFADELIAKLAAERRLYGTTDTFFLILNGSLEVLETIEVALERRHLYVAQRTKKGEYRLLAAPTHLVTTFEAALELREFTASELASKLKLKPPAVNNRIRQLAEAGVLVRREQVPKQGGREYRYRAAA